MGYHFSSGLTATLNLCLIYFNISSALAILLEHMHKKFEKNQTKIKGGCQSGRKVVTHNSKSRKNNGNREKTQIFTNKSGLRLQIMYNFLNIQKDLAI